MQQSALIFGLEDDRDDQESIIEAFKDEQLFNYEFFADIAEFFHVIQQYLKTARVVVIDYNLPGGTGQEVLDKLKLLIPKLKATIISGKITPKMSVQLSMSGARDCVEKEKGWEKALAKIVKKHVVEADAELETERLEEEEKRILDERKDKANEIVKTLLKS